MTKSEISRAKRLVFSLVPAGILVALLVLTELVLRVTTSDPRQPLTRPVRYDGIDWLEVNRGFLAPYFPGDVPSIPEFKPSLVRRVKPANGFRIICLGGSSMFGTPYDMNGNIPGMIRKQLRRAFPGREVEVLNLGATAINSHVIRDFSRLLPDLQPDAVLIYMGHNEFYGPEGVGASWFERVLGFPSPWKYALRNLRLVQLAGRILSSSPRAGGEEANLMKQVSAGQLVPLESSEARRVFASFEENLREIIGTFRERGIPVFVSEVSSSMLFPPFVGDSLSVSCYRSARSALASGDTANGRRLLEEARDRDLLKFRAPTPVNEIIHRVTRATGTPCVAADSVLRSLSPGGITGDELFWEHLHPTLWGYYCIAGVFLDRMVREGVVPRVLPIPFDRDSLSISWFEEANADLSIQHLTGRWPFTDYHRTPAVIGGAPERLLGVVVETYNRSIPWNEGCYRSATYFWSTGDLRRAQTTYEAMLEEYPWSYYTNYLMGTLLNVGGKPDQAVEYYRRSISSNGSYVKARIDLGLLEVSRGNLEIGIGLLTGALGEVQGTEGAELRSVVHYGLAAAFANRGERSKALTSLEESLRAFPGNRNARALREQILRGE